VSPLLAPVVGIGGSDDLDPLTEVGFPSTCPAVTVTGGPACGGSILSLADLVECLSCGVLEFKAGCMDAATVPAFVDYPEECNP
jgi:hypothetical protein